MKSQRMRQGGWKSALLAAAWVGALSASGSVGFAQQVKVGPTEWFREEPAAPVPTVPVMLGDPALMPPQPAAPVAPVAPVAQPVPVAPPQPQPALPVQQPAQVAQQPAAANFPAAVQRPYRMPPIGGNTYGSPYGSVSGLYPSAEMNSYVMASARAATARALYRLADSELGQAYRAAQRQFDTSAEFKAAVKDEKEAYDALTASRTKAIASLSGDTKYQRLLALWQDLGDRLDDLRGRGILSQDQIVAMAKLKMSYANEMRSIEAQAMANEPLVRQSQDRLVAAGSRLSALRQSYANSLRANPDILMARRNFDDARISKLTAEAYLYAAAVNGSNALDYSYYLYRRPTNVNNGYGSTYAGYGY